MLPAIYNIGNFYSSGTGGVEQSDEKAYQYYFAAAQVIKLEFNSVKTKIVEVKNILHLSLSLFESSVLNAPISLR